MNAWPDLLVHKPVNTRAEIGAYEYLWQQPRSSMKRLAKLFGDNPGSLPSELVNDEAAVECAASAVVRHFEKRGIKRFGIRLNGTLDYPAHLRDALEPAELLYFMGSWDLAEAPRRVAVVGTRKVSREGAARTRGLVRLLVEHDFTIVSGLALGVDTIAHQTAIEEGGRTVAVIGTPISEAYPAENAELQRRMATKYLVVSQVPVLRYMRQEPGKTGYFSPSATKPCRH